MKRKHLLFLLIVLSTSQIAQAQIKKGSIFLGGSVFFSSYKADSDFSDFDRKQTNFGFSPAAGQFVKDNLVFGGELQIGGYRTEFGHDQTQKFFTVGAGTFGRQYFSLVNRLYIFAHARFGVNYIREKNRSLVSWADSKGYNVGISVYPGLSFAVSKKVYLETALANMATLYYAHKKISESNASGNSTTKRNDFHFSTSIDSGTELTVGVRVII